MPTCRGANSTPIQQALFAYRDESTADGSLNDLQSSTQQLPAYHTVGITDRKFDSKRAPAADGG
jgi:hypothetical protein